jgi:hypothetical protein
MHVHPDDRDSRLDRLGEREDVMKDPFLPFRLEIVGSMLFPSETRATALP